MMLRSTVSVTCLSPPQSPLCVIWRLVRGKKRKHVGLFLLEYPPSGNLCEERGGMPKQALKLFVIACYIMYCLTRLQNSPYFCVFKQSPKQSRGRSGVRLKTESKTGERYKKNVSFFSLCEACALHVFETLMIN